MPFRAIGTKKPHEGLRRGRFVGSAAREGHQCNRAGFTLRGGGIRCRVTKSDGA